MEVGERASERSGKVSSVQGIQFSDSFEVAPGAGSKLVGVP